MNPFLNPISNEGGKKIRELLIERNINDESKQEPIGIIQPNSLVETSDIGSLSSSILMREEEKNEIPSTVYGGNYMQPQMPMIPKRIIDRTNFRVYIYIYIYILFIYIF
jgi:hypothetical protein